MSAHTDLNGLWTGSYSYRAGSLVAVAFTAWLDDHTGAIGGTIMEPNSFADSQTEDLSSAVNGVRSGADLSFTKIYDPGQGAHAHPIQYSGKANRDFTWIVGSWRIPGHFGSTGPFEMSRHSGSFEQAERVRKAELLK